LKVAQPVIASNGVPYLQKDVAMITRHRGGKGKGLGRLPPNPIQVRNQWTDLLTAEEKPGKPQIRDRLKAV
jgi:hypothetical protein